MSMIDSIKYRGFGGGSGGGGVSSWNDLTDRPFWKETVKEPSPFGQITVVTADTGYGINFAQANVAPMADTTNFVVFDGVEYECEPYFDEELGTVAIGSFDFSNYPFCIANGMLITKTAGEHTVQQYIIAHEIKADYAPFLHINTSRTDDWIPYLEMADVKKIKEAYSNGVPIRLETNRGTLSVVMQVIDVSEHFIFAHGFGSAGSYVMEHIEYQFSVNDGSLYESNIAHLGSIVDNSYSYPVMYIGNKRYKITVNDDGTLSATKLT